MKLLRILAVSLLAAIAFAQIAPPSPSSGPTSSIVGQLQTATGGVIKGGTLTFTLSQPAIAASTASIVSQTSSCYTSTQGNVVGLPDPVALPIVSTNIVTGTLSAGTYYVKVFYLNASLSVSAPSPETQIILTSNGTLIVNAPAFQPANATGYGVAIGSTSGSETIQGTVTGWGQFQQATALVTGAALQATNNSTCNLWFSDALIPTGTNYSVNLVNANGSQIAGFPQTWCTYGGGNGTINVSQGAPTGNCNVNGVYYPMPIFANPSSSSQSIAGTLNVGALNVSGSVTLPNLNSIRFPTLFTGGDCGAKVNAAGADLGASPGEIWINQSCGLAWTTAVSVSSNHVLRFIQCGVYTTTQTVTLTGTNAGILGPPSTMSSTSCVLQAASGAGLAAVVSMPGNTTFLNDITIDGNQAAGGTTGATAAAVLIAGAGGRQDIQRVTVQNSSGYGIEVAGGCCIKINRLMAITNVGSGLFGTVGDGFVSDSEFENNGGSGIELSDAPAWRIMHSDFGGNGTGGVGGKGIKLYGTAAGGHSSYEIIAANQFGNNRNEDIFIAGYDTVGGNYAATQSTIVGNSFIGSGSGRAAVPSVRIADGYQHQIVGNWFAADATTTYGLNFTETAGGRSLASTVVGNSFNQGFITGYYDDSTITNPNVVTANSEGTSGFSRLGPHPYLLNNSGLYAKDSGGTPVSLLFLGANNATYLWGHPTQKTIYFQANPGTTSLGLTGTGVNPDTAGFKHKRVTGCTTGATSGNTCTTTVTWTTAFADANYTPVCTLLGPATLGHLAAISTDVIAAASVKVETVTDTNAAISGTINCVAVHD